MAGSLAVVGLQWGDEGKGKIVDVLSEDCDYCVRFNGGANAGHTVILNNGKEFVFHLLPTGLLRENVKGIIGNGVVLDPEQFFAEIEQLNTVGVDVSNRLFVSERTHIVLPFHKTLDGAKEALDATPIGTTKRGIGLAYADKASRSGLRAADLVEASRNSSFARKRLLSSIKEKSALFSAYRLGTINESELLDWLHRYGQMLRPFVTDTATLLRKALASRKKVLFEGAQGALLDIDFGTYPFVTSSQTGVWGISAGTGVPLRRAVKVLGVLKAYTTRVGEGPFPTEESGEIGKRLRAVGGEFGATTARPRRCGWLDLVAAKYASLLNGVDGLIITKMDVLTGMSPLKVAVAYEIDGKRTDTFPTLISDFETLKPLYEELDGWDEPINSARRLNALPKEARQYLRFIERYLGTPIEMVSVGMGRDAIIRTKGKQN
ncbi:MAG: adenylosuccinate synthase [Planctomycetota bacterium]|nr:adenylosuccinate synthase [Planctomycetota bacterium]